MALRSLSIQDLLAKVSMIFSKGNFQLFSGEEKIEKLTFDENTLDILISTTGLCLLFLCHLKFENYIHNND